MNALKNKNLFDLNRTIARGLFYTSEFPYQVISVLDKFILQQIKVLDRNEFNINNNIAIHRNADVSTKAEIIGPTIIDEFAIIRPFSYIRGNVIVGKNVVIGNSSELKNSIIFDYAQIPHFNYIGDSIIGYKSHVGAGVILSNLKSDKSNVTIWHNNEKVDTGLKKFGSALGDKVEVGCNSVLNPGTVIGRNTTIYPVSNVRGYIKENNIYKDKNTIVEKKDVLGKI